METEKRTFILNRKKTFRRGVKIYVKDVNGKMTPRLLPFTTEHLVAAKERRKRARTIPAEYTTNDPLVIEALLRDTAYGKDFTQRGDPGGKLKQKSIVITPDDIEKIALRGLFNSAKLPFDESLSIDMLREIYRAHNSILSGKDIKGSPGMSIPHVQVDVAKSIADTTAEAVKIYEDKYGEPIPEAIDDLPHEQYLGFLSALADPDFDAKRYIENLVSEVPPKESTVEVTEDTIEQLQGKYFEKYKKNPANAKKTDRAWLKAKLEE